MKHLQDWRELRRLCARQLFCLALKGLKEFVFVRLAKPLQVRGELALSLFAARIAEFNNWFRVLLEVFAKNEE